MSVAYWRQVVATDFEVPADRPLDDLTTELTTMLGSPDPQLRDDTAFAALATWAGRGVYDDLLAGLGDGMVAGLPVGLGESGTDTVFRRSFSALVLAVCIARDNEIGLLPSRALMSWGDHVATWYLREQDTRGFVPGKGWAHAVAHGADALGELAASRHLAAPELTVLLDVISERLTLPTTALLSHGEPDRIAAATMAVLRRDLVPLSVLEPWVNRLTAAATSPEQPGLDPFLVRGDTEAFLRALHLQLVLAPDPPQVRADLLLVLVDALRRTNRSYLATRG